MMSYAKQQRERMIFLFLGMVRRKREVKPAKYDKEELAEKLDK